MIVAKAIDFESWRDEARRLLSADVRPEDVAWDDGMQSVLFASEAPPGKRTARVSAAFVEKAEIACSHGDPDKYAVLYRLLWKLTHVDPKVLEDPIDPDTARLTHMLRDVRAEEHDMHAFVRFRELPGDRWAAWYRPKHPVLKRVAPFFARRYPAMNWAIFTPEISAHWDGQEITYGPGSNTDVAPPPDALDALFVTYYSSIFNPARTNLTLMQQHIPSRIQRQLPEGVVMNRLARESVGRVARMAKPPSASLSLIPESRDLESLRRAACECRACPIGERATQTVFGEGPTDAQLMIVGEQPGDEEDRAGHPFVGPAGRLLDDLMDAAKLPRDQIYVTNAVKHFKWEPRGKRRLHSRPNRSEIEACNGWLLAEIEVVKPRMILCLGATAAQSFAGAGFRVQRDRGKPQKTPWAEWWMASYHPSALLRAADDQERRMLERTLVEDLVTAREEMFRATERNATA